MAFEYFASVSIDIAVLEVGMGGRLDATNVVNPLISVIADISLDHQRYLGETIGEIAREKAGIIRENGLVVTLPQHPEANDVIGNTILERNATGVSAVKYTPPVSPGAAEYLAGIVSPVSGRNRYPLNVMGEEVVVDSPLVGRHQFRNIALAIATAEELGAVWIQGHGDGRSSKASAKPTGRGDSKWFRARKYLQVIMHVIM